MNRVERMAAILLLLQERARTAGEIARHFEVSRRTVLRDVQALSEMGVPVIAREGPGGGYSLPADYHLDPLPLTGSEAFLLLLALSAIERLSDLPFRAERATLMAKLRALLPGDTLPGAEGLMSSVGLDIPQRDTPTPFLGALVQAAQQSRWVRITYQSSERISTQHLLPRLVYNQDGYWYCRAYTHERQDERTYRVDRIQALYPPEEDFTPEPVVEPLPYDHESHPLVSARLTVRGALLVETERHMGGQVRRLPDGTGEVAFRCPPGELDWYARFFAGLGPEVEVLEPDELRRKMRELGENLLARYPKR
jgi:predicted DNA-binding transcriptional regulator YafY